MVLPFGKPKRWKVFEEHPHLLYRLGRDDYVNNTEKCVFSLVPGNKPLTGGTNVDVNCFKREVEISKVIKSYQML